MVRHQPVLLAEVLEILSPKEGDRILDVTVGLGGHSREILARAGASGFLIALDADPTNLEAASRCLPREKVLLLHTNFIHLPDCLPPEHREFDVILADLGISSPHLDDGARGFSFRMDAPLDMRLDQSTGEPASMMLSSLDRESLIRIFRDFGEIYGAHRLVDELISRRRSSPVRTTFALSDAVKKAYGTLHGRDCLPQAFQALRIAVNAELDALTGLLKRGPDLLAIGGRFGVISFHSLEDRMVKHAFKTLTSSPKDEITGREITTPNFELLTKRAVVPSDEELSRNPRSRSARLRAICRSAAYTSPRS